MGKSKNKEISFKNEGLLNQMSRDDSVSTKSRPKVLSRIAHLSRNILCCYWFQMKRKNQVDNDFIEDKLSAKILEQARSQLNELVPKSKAPPVRMVWFLKMWHIVNSTFFHEQKTTSLGENSANMEAHSDDENWSDQEKDYSTMDFVNVCSSNFIQNKHYNLSRKSMKLMRELWNALWTLILNHEELWPTLSWKRLPRSKPRLIHSSAIKMVADYSSNSQCNPVHAFVLISLQLSTSKNWIQELKPCIRV